MKYLKSFGLLILRICIGAMLIHHGYEKLENIPNFANAFVKPLGLPFPEFFSYVAALFRDSRKLVANNWIVY